MADILIGDWHSFLVRSPSWHTSVSPLLQTNKQTMISEFFDISSSTPLFVHVVFERPLILNILILYQKLMGSRTPPHQWIPWNPSNPVYQSHWAQRAWPEKWCRRRTSKVHISYLHTVYDMIKVTKISFYSFAELWVNTARGTVTWKMLSGLKEIHLKTVSVLHKLVSRGYVSGGEWVHCTPYFVMDYNAPSNVEN